MATMTYTPINAAAAQLVDREAYEEQVKKQQAYIAANPTAAQPMTQAEKSANYADIVNNTAQSGYYTQNAAAAQAAADQYGVAVTPTSYNGQEGWYLVDQAERTTQKGASGADESILMDADYAIIQQLKQDYAAAQEQYMSAAASGDTASAEAAKQTMKDAHLQAERVRAGYSYSGGLDGSMYIPKSLLNTDTEPVSGSSGDHGGSSESGYTGGLTAPGGGDLTGLVEDYSGYLEQMYAAQKAGALAQLQAAYESSLAALDRAGTGVAEQYQNARNQTVGASELTRRNFAEYAAASGLNSGTGGQAELARSVTLQNNLNTLNQAEADTLADLELQRANAEIQYNGAIAQAKADGDYALAEALYQEKVRVQNALISAEIQEYQNAVKQYQLEYQAQRDQVSDRQWADELAFQWQKYLTAQK